MAKRNTQFQTIRTEGAILPADILQRIAALKVDGVSTDAYHLPPNTKLNEAISQSWTSLLAHWKAFRETSQSISDTEAGTAFTNEHWLLPLFKELDYGRLLTGKPPEIDGRVYPIRRFYNHVPIHLIGCKLSLDRRTRGARGAATAIPHSMMQEFLNRSDESLWGFLSNGLQLRILRDNVSLSRQAYVEFDLEALFDGEVYSDFALLWLLCHQSRVEADKPEECWLEKWSRLAREEGTRVLKDLRVGVAKAIEALGRGFISHPRNDHLREKLHDGALSKDDFYRQLLRIVYRLLFLFVAEDRELLHPPDSPEEARSLYDTHYSTRRLRDLALKIRGSKHADLWHSLSLVFDALGKNEGCPQLALCGLGSFLWRAGSTADLLGPHQVDQNTEPVLIANDDLLQAIRELAYVEQDRVLRHVDYRNLGSEELGSVYEALLELHPVMNVEGKSFELLTAAGNERKITGSYYTPDSLVQCLLDSALDPVVEERLAKARRMAGLLKKGVGSSQIANRGKDDDRVVSGSDRVATGHGTGPGNVSGDTNVSERGTFRADQPDAPCGGVHRVEHRGGVGTTDDESVHTVSASGSGQRLRTGDTTDSGGRFAVPQSADCPQGADADQGNPQNAPLPDWVVAAQELWLESNPPTSLPPCSLLAEQALLALKVCDPACGSGHFLIAAAHRLARHLARVRTGEAEPSPEDYQHALRDVIGRCIYGVDINPMAVELCKVSLWMEALEPGKPLSFLDHHIQCGNSLLGTTPALLKQGIPDDAFKPIEGDVKGVCAELKRDNRKERKDYEQGYRDLHVVYMQGNLPAEFARLGAASEESLDDLARKEKQYERLVKETAYQNARLLADAWCAVFVWKKDNSDLGRLCLTERGFRNLEANPHSILPHVKSEVQRLSRQYQFFHWHLAFPDVFRIASSEAGNDEAAHAPSPTGYLATSLSPSPAGWTGGFDVVLANPPWERVKLQEKEWFATRHEDIATAPNAAARKRLIKKLPETDPELYREFCQALRQAEGISHLLRDSGAYPLCGRGDVNVYTVFAELFRNRLAAAGRFGAVLPSGIATDDTTKFYFQDVIETRSLVSFYDFENKNIFPEVHSSYKFCLMTAGSGLVPLAEAAEFAFFCHAVDDLREPGKRFTLSPEDIELLNPNTRTCPIFRSTADAELTKWIYRRVPVLIKEARDGRPEENPWGIKFATMFHMSNDSHLFRTREQLEAEGYVLEGNVFRKREPVGSSEVGSRDEAANGETVANRESRMANGEEGRVASGESRVVEEYLPLYEAKMIHHFDHRWATYENGSTRDLTLEEKQDPNHVVCGRYWVHRSDVQSALANVDWNHQWLIGWRDITNSTNERSVVGGSFPIAAVGNNLPIWACAEENSDLFATAMSSFAADFPARFKIGGTHLNFFIAQQIPVLPPSTFNQPAHNLRLVDDRHTRNDHSPFAIRRTRLTTRHSLLATRRPLSATGSSPVFSN